jgi:hypothetical protein
MKRLANHLRMRYSGVKGDYRIFCNSPLPEKLIARESGLGAIGRNSLIINAESGSLFIIAAMALPITLETDLPISGRLSNFCASGASAADTGVRDFPLCTDCGENPPCAAACPTGAAQGNGHIDRAKCIQWYASGHSASSFASNCDADEIPADVRAVWGNRLYGCTSCLDACVHNKRPIKGVQTDEGPLPAFIDARELLRLSDCEIKALFKGTAMGLSWLGAKAIRRNAEMVSRPPPVGLHALRASVFPPPQTCLCRWRRRCVHFDSGLRCFAFNPIIRVNSRNLWLIFQFRRGALFPRIIANRCLIVAPPLSTACLRQSSATPARQRVPLRSALASRMWSFALPRFIAQTLKLNACVEPRSLAAERPLRR